MTNSPKTRTGKRNDPLAPYAPIIERQKEAAAGQARRLVLGLSQVDGICRALADLDYGMAAAALDGELATWTKKAGALATALRRMQRTLKEVTPRDETQQDRTAARR